MTVRSRRGFMAAAVALCLAAAWADLSAEEEESKFTTVRLGLARNMFMDLPEPALRALMKPINQLMESEAGVTAQVVAAKDPDHLGRCMTGEQVQLGLFSGIEFAWTKCKHPKLQPLVIAVNERTFVRACMVVRKDSAAAAVADLKGKVCALPKGSRPHCRLFLQNRCQQCGNDPCKYFSQVASPTTVEDALDDVVDGLTDAAVVDELALDCFKDLKPVRHSRLKVLQLSEDFPTGVIAYMPGTLEEGELKRFRDALLQLSKNPKASHWLTLWRLTGFENVPADYEKILKEIVKVYPPPPQTAEETKKGEE